ncbi:discoidin domain-containing protein [Lactiplantibacillus modestisalitolerans]|uniref:Discoidin domain-containing protein n=1 Tax=Lactiplantibacillus modestisalitolerans TaxID=1457219 RepID=A0ABV5WSU6_9LACO|nr:discoidin domain-containing protein [Lactiplantibacillus modestisalitolerans]
MDITIQLLDQDNHVKTGVFSYDKIVKPYMTTGRDLAVLGIKDMTWQPGEKIQVKLDQAHQYVWVQLDETLAPTLVYMAHKHWIYTIAPDKRNIDTAFASKRHCIMVRKASEADIKAYRNLALNPHDQAVDTGVYPHAVSNVTAETNPTFLASNAIDGKLANISHGSYPYGSWGIHEQADAALTIDFGREVEVDCVKLLLRHDRLEWDHDGFWDQVTIGFSDGETMDFKTVDTADLQSFTFPARRTTKIVLNNLKKAANSARFLALTQIEVYGYNKA